MEGGYHVMSNVIDQRVAELRFDNAHFEKNVATSMSTLDKLKQKLNLTGASKGLEDLGAAARKIDMTPLGKGVETVQAKFSALQIAGITALTNITNQAVNAGKRIAASLTIDPVKTGFNEYELKMGSIQTIMASTGESLEVVNGYLNELNEYSDKTIYSFSDMTQNIGKFTNAGVKLEDAVAAIQGISNEAALSGANANEASRAMYNFAQALSAGYVKLIDWKSIENANMATVGFKEELIATAVEMGTLTKTTEGYETAEGKVITATKNFNDSLQDQWMTSDVLISTLKRYSDETTDIGKKATQAATEVKTFSQMMDSLKESAQSGWAQTWEIVFGDFYEGKQLWTSIYNTVSKILDKMSDARNSLLKGAFNSKWDQLVEKVNAAGISTEEFSETVKAMAKEAGIPIDELIEKHGSLAKVIAKGKIPAEIFRKAIKKLIGAEDDLSKSTDTVTKTVENLDEIVKKVMRGEFGNGEERMKKLAEAGYDYATVQNKVNEILGSSVRHTSSLTDAQKKQVSQLAKLDDETLKNKGYTEDQIKAIRELEKAAEGAGTSIDELINSMDKPSGRELLLDSFKNIGEEVKKIFKAISDAWHNVFGLEDGKTGSDVLYDWIKKFHDITESMEISEDSAKNFKDVMEGLFSLFKLSGSVASMSVVAGLKILNAFLGLFGSDILGVAGALGRYITKFNEWVEAHTMFGWDTSYEKIAKVMKAIYDGVSSCVRAFLSLDKVKGIVQNFKKLLSDMFGFLNDGKGFDINMFNVDNIVNAIKNAFAKLESWIKGLNDRENLGLAILEGLWNGLKSGAGKVVNIMMDVCSSIFEAVCSFFGIASPAKKFIEVGKWCIEGLLKGFNMLGPGRIIKVMIKIGSTILNAIKGFLGIHSPSKKFAEIASDCIDGLAEGFKNGFGKVKKFMGDFAQKCLETMKKIDWGKVLAVGLSVGLIVTLKKLTDAMNTFIEPFASVGKGIGSFLTSIGNGLEAQFKAEALDKKSNAILKIAIAIGVLVASVVVLSKIPVGTLWSSIGALTALAGIIVGLAFACEKLNKVGEFGLQSTSLLAIGGSIALLAIALKQLSEIDVEKVPQAMGMLAGVVIALGFLIASIMVLSKNNSADALNKVGGLLIKLSIALILMVGVIKLASKLDNKEIVRGLAVVAGIEILFSYIIAVSYLAGEHASKAGGMMVKMSFALLAMLAVIKLASKLDNKEIVRGLAVVAGIEVLFAYIIAVSYFAGEHASKAGSMVLKISIALLLMVGVVKIAAGLSAKDIIKGVAVVAAFGGIIAGLIAISKFSGEQAAKAGAMLIEAAVAMLLMSAVLIILKELDPDGIVKALGIMTAIGGIFAGLIAVTSLAKDVDKVKGVLITLTVAITILALALVALSMLDEKKVAIATGALSAVLGMFALLIKSLGGLKMDKRTWWRKLVAIGVLTAVVVAIGLMIHKLSKIKKPQKVIQVAEGISLLLITMAASLNVLSNSKSFNKGKLLNILGVMAILSGVVIVLAEVLKAMKGVNGAHAIGNATAISILITTLSLLTTALVKMDGRKTQKLPKIIANIALLSTVCIILADVLKAMKDVPAERGIANATALSELISVLAGVTLLLSNFSKSSKNLYGSVGAIAILGAVLYELADVLIELDKVDARNSIPNATALSELMAVLAGLTIPISRFTKVSGNMWGAVGAIAALGAVLYELAGALIIMKDIDADNGIKNAAALTLMMVALGGLPVAFSYLCKNPIGMFAGAAVMAVLGIAVAELAYILALMDKIDGKNAIANAAALSILLTFMTPVAATMALLGTFAVPMLAGIGAMAVLGLVVGMLAEVLIKTKELDPLRSIGVAVALGTLLTVMTLVTGALLGIGAIIVSSGLIGVAAIAAGFAAIVAVIAGIVAVITAAGYISDRWENLEVFLDKGLGLFKKLAEGIGEIVGLLLGGILSGVQSALPNFGKSLSEFMTNIQGFIDGARGLSGDDSFRDGVRILTEAVMLMLAAEFINGIINATGLGLFGSLSSLGTELTLFWYAAQGFIEGAKQLDPSLMQGVKTLSEAIIILTAAEFINGIMRWVTGGVNYQVFADGMATLGTGVKDFIANVGTIDDTSVSVAQHAADIITKLATAAAAIPNAGGLLADLVGDNDLGTWAGGLKDVATGISDFCSTLVNNGITEDSVKVAGHAANIISTLAGASSKIPNTGGLLADLVGDNDFATWGKSLGDVGSGIAKFCSHFAETPLTDTQVDIAKKAAKIVTTLAQASAAIPNAGGWLAKLVGENDLSTWAKEMPNLATGVTGFVNNLGDFDETQIAKANSAAKLIGAIANMCKQNAGLSFAEIATKFESFNAAITSLCDGVKTFVDKLGGVSTESIDTAVASLKAVMDACKTTAADTDVKSLKTFGESLKTMATDGINKLIKAFSSEDAKTKIHTAGGKLMESFKKGIESKKDAPKKAIKAAVKSAYKAAGSEDMKLNFRSAGVDCAKGFANGLKDENTIAKVKSAGTALGKAALKAAKEALDENSPSKEFYKIGEFAGMGLTNALYDYESRSYKAGYSVAEYAKNGLSKAIAKVNELFNSEVETQPTIRPILDLSDVTSGAGVLNRMFDTTANVGISSNIRSISSMMNNRQNGNNDDVISAIKDLSASLGNNTGDSYYISGVSYDGEDGVAEAIKTIARAALVERRI